MTTETTTTKPEALAAYLECDPDEVSEDRYGTYDAPGGEYSVFTEDEAEEAAADAIRDSVWAFAAWFIADHAPDGIYDNHIDDIRGRSCEGSNDAMVALIEAGSGMERFISDAISVDGLGHFLAHYDGNENDSPCGQYLIFRTN